VIRSGTTADPREEGAREAGSGSDGFLRTTPYAHTIEPLTRERTMPRPDDIAKRFHVSPGVKFLSQEQCAAELKLIGLKEVPPSYAWVKRVFGNSKLSPFGFYFWINTADAENTSYSMINRKKLLLNRTSSYRRLDGTYDYQWFPDEGVDKTIAEKINFSNLVPLCMNSQYDLWYTWDLSQITASGEPPILIFDLGTQIIEMILPDIYELYEAIADADGNDGEYDKAADGKIILVPM